MFKDIVGKDIIPGSIVVIAKHWSYGTRTMMAKGTVYRISQTKWRSGRLRNAISVECERHDGRKYKATFTKPQHMCVIG